MFLLILALNQLYDKISSPDSNYVSPLKSKNQQNSIFQTQPTLMKYKDN